tara:strand:+ start:386 stop:1165 length:780 start_codon:yes stop_codon:yes gene_type:complete
MAAVTTAVIGIATAGIAAAQSFQAAADAKSASDTANNAAAKAMAEAKAKAEKDSFSGLTVPLDAFEAEFENNLAVQQQNVEALQEGDARGLAAGVGRVGAQGTDAAEGTRIKMGEEISDLNMLKAESKDAINQQLIEMDVANAREQNQRRADAEALRAQSIQSGITSVGQGLTSAADLVPLYNASGANRRGGKLAKQFSKQKPAGMDDAKWKEILAAQYGESNDSFWGGGTNKYKSLREDGTQTLGKWNEADKKFEFEY